MADKKISALTSATTPLAGTEELPIVQSNTTKKVTVANLTEGRAVSATSVTITTGSLVVGTAGQGIDFSATPGTGTSELFDDYEEGVWSPLIQGTTSAGTATYAAQAGVYTKIGNKVFVEGYVNYNSGTGTGNLRIGGLPFTPVSASVYGSVTIQEFNNIALAANTIPAGDVAAGTAVILLYQNLVGGGAVSSVAYDAAGFLTFGAHYTTAA